MMSPAKRLFAALLMALIAAPSLPGAAALANEINLPPGAGWSLAGDEIVSLRPETTVETPAVTLGDLFSGLAPSQAAIPVDRAPAPGERTILNANVLDTLATRHGIDWRASSPYERVVVQRRGYPVGHREIVEALRAPLEDAGMPAGAEIAIGATQVHAMVGTPEEARPVVHDVSLNTRSNRFSAVLDIPTGGRAMRTVRLTGYVHVQMEVPVLIRPVRRGVTINEDDVTWQQVRRAELRPDALLDAEDLIGMAARNGIQAGRPVRAGQVRRPEAVSRNGLVMMVLETPFLSVTARGRALEAGAVGETVRVVNVTSDKEVLAVVSGENTVRVRLGLTTAYVQ